MTVKFVKDINTVPTFVHGYGWAYTYKGKTNRGATVSIREVGLEEGITFDVKEVPALIAALEQAVAHANAMADKDAAKVTVTDE